VVESGGQKKAQRPWEVRYLCLCLMPGKVRVRTGVAMHVRLVIEVMASKCMGSDLHLKMLAKPNRQSAVNIE
jgi:hypothetical protein